MNYPQASMQGASDQDIAIAVREILTEAEGPLLMSTLGSRLSRRFSKPLREILGNRKLKSLIESSLGSRAAMTGSLSKIEVRLLDDAEVPQPRRYDPTVWAAFAKPITSGKLVRGIDVAPPFSFDDFSQLSEMPLGWKVIPTSAIPPSELAKDERELLIKESILNWCLDQGVDPQSLNITGRQKNSKPNDVAHKVLVDDDRRAALLRFIEAVPASERGRFNLPLDLIYQFLK